MTENEAIEILDGKTRKQVLYQYEALDRPYIIAQAEYIAIKALQEIQQYRKVGTVKECKAAVEKQKAQAPHIWGDGTDSQGQIIYDMYDCPNCGQSYEIDYDDYNYCPECGQRIERIDLE